MSTKQTMVSVTDLRLALREMIAEDENQARFNRPDGRDTARDCIERLKNFTTAANPACDEIDAFWLSLHHRLSIEDAQEFAPYGFSIRYRNAELTLVASR